MRSESGVASDQVVTVTLENVPPAQQPDTLLGLGAALLALACAGSLAARRNRRPAEPAPPRLMRIFAAASLFASSLTLWLVADELSRSGASGELPVLAAVAAAAFLVVGLVLFGIADFWLAMLRPRRSRRWLAAAILLFMLLVGLCLAIALWATDPPANPIQANLAVTIVIAAAAGIAWWSYLPAPRADVAGRFE